MSWGGYDLPEGATAECFSEYSYAHNKTLHTLVLRCDGLKTVAVPYTHENLWSAFITARDLLFAQTFPM